MSITHGNAITPSDDARFFLAPEKPLHRQYEALRAFFVDGGQSNEVAHRFGYTPGAFRVLCHQFRHDDAKRSCFFQDVRHGPQVAPSRDRVRHLAVAMRKKSLSVYDIQRELASAGHKISINALSVLMREEGFSVSNDAGTKSVRLRFVPRLLLWRMSGRWTSRLVLSGPGSGDCFCSYP